MGIADFLRKASRQVVNSYSVADKAKALAQQRDGQEYSPGQPLQPQHQNNPPWAFQYQVGRNLVVNPRTEDPRLTPFQVLRTLAETHDITAICWKMMVDQVTGDEWDIVPADKNDRGNHKAAIEEVKHFFYKPDKVHLFNDWLKPYLTDKLQIDAGCLYKRRTRNGKLYSLDYVDGTGIKCLIDDYGRVPQPPYAAYQQIVYGMPYGSSSPTTLGFTTDDIIYRPRYPRTWTQYGFAPTEQILMKINIMMRRDDFHLRYFTKGALPDAGLFQVDAEWTPEQIQQYQELWNDVMSGNINERLAMRFVPKGSYTPTKEFKFDSSVDEWIARLVAISFGVNPQAFISAMNRATANMQDQQQTDIGLAPLEKHLEEEFSDIIQNELGFPQLKFKYIDEKKEDAQLTITRDMQYVDRGILTVDEVRSNRGLAPLTNLPDGVPPYIKLGNDVVLLTEEFIKAKSEAQVKALEQGDYQVGNIQNMNIRTKQADEKGDKKTDSSEEKEQPDKTDAEEKKTAQKMIADELKQFEKFALRRLKKKTKRDFEANILSAELVKMMNEKLKTMDSPNEIKAFFMDVGNFKKDASVSLADGFDDLEEYLLEQADDLTEDVINLPDSDEKKALLMLLLFARYDFEEKFKPILSDMLTRYAKASFKQAEGEIKNIGDIELSDSRRNELIDSVVEDRLSFLLPEFERVTKEKVGSLVSNALDKKQLKDSIADAYATSDEREQLISKTENAVIGNITRIKAAKESSLIVAVLVSDGDGCTICSTIDGQIWSLEEAESNPIQHPNCIRQFTFLTADEAKIIADKIGEEYNVSEKPTKFYQHKLPSDKQKANYILDHVGKNGAIKTRRFFNESGDAKLDIHLAHSGENTHTFPHAHDWEDGKPINTRELTDNERDKIKDLVREE